MSKPVSFISHLPTESISFSAGYSLIILSLSYILFSLPFYIGYSEEFDPLCQTEYGQNHRIFEKSVFFLIRQPHFSNKETPVSGKIPTNFFGHLGIPGGNQKPEKKQDWNYRFGCHHENRIAGIYKLNGQIPIPIATIDHEAFHFQRMA